MIESSIESPFSCQQSKKVTHYELRFPTAAKKYSSKTGNVPAPVRCLVEEQGEWPPCIKGSYRQKTSPSKLLKMINI